MSRVTLRDLRRMGEAGGYTIQLKRNFPFTVSIGQLKAHGIEFKRVGFVEGVAKEVVIREPYSHNILHAIGTIKCQKTLVAFRQAKDNHLLLTGKGYYHVH